MGVHLVRASISLSDSGRLRRRSCACQLSKWWPGLHLQHNAATGTLVCTLAHLHDATGTLRVLHSLLLCSAQPPISPLFTSATERFLPLERKSGWPCDWHLGYPTSRKLLDDCRKSGTRSQKTDKFQKTVTTRAVYVTECWAALRPVIRLAVSM